MCCRSKKQCLERSNPKQETSVGHDRVLLFVHARLHCVFDYCTRKPQVLGTYRDVRCIGNRPRHASRARFQAGSCGLSLPSDDQRVEMDTSSFSCFVGSQAGGFPRSSKKFPLYSGSDVLTSLVRVLWAISSNSLSLCPVTVLAASSRET